MPKPQSDIDHLSRVILGEFERVHERFDAMDARFDRLERSHKHLTAEIADIRRNLDSLEAKVGNALGFAKEIDHLLQRVVAIEKHLGLDAHIKA